ncbi:cytochrome P450 [Sphaerisporangium rufum]|uniref:Cytochrome P450 n=1 Tax=Sphaerisporangium rufum TaxID=1381558 RepID=A0A919V1C7_9ACTN|nr:cytochrome P450 [Sphaerisporangium rufum]GII80966.1 cytochrome P450 [Sphaerisporangium rufum]
MAEPVENDFPLPFPPEVPVPWEPAPVLAALRRDRPVAPVALPTGDRAWLVTRHADNRAMLADPRFSRAAAAAPGAPRARAIPLERDSMTTMDPPEHTRLRGLVMRAFTARRVETMRPRVEELVAELLDAMAAGGRSGDVVAGLARPLAITVICELLGVPKEDREGFQEWSETYLAVTGAPPEAMREAGDRLKAFLAELVAAKRREPADDLLSALAGAAEGDRLTESELVTLGVTLLVAGYETAANLISGAVYALLTHPAQLAALRGDPALLVPAVEELLRYVPLAVTGGTIRVAVADAEVGGTPIRRGEAVLPATTSANRDASVFDRPDELDLARRPNPHLAFGHGPHHCLGAQLARLELGAAVAGLLATFPELRPAVPAGRITWSRGKMIRGPESLPVAW